MRRVSGQSGFSLVEMLVVLGLLAFATAISFPVLQNSNKKNDVVAFKSVLMKSLSEARNKALLSGLDQYVDVDLKKRIVSGTTGTVSSFPDAVSVTAESAKFEELNGTYRYLFFGAGGNSGGKIVVTPAPQSDDQRSTQFEIALNWFSGEISTMTVRTADED